MNDFIKKQKNRKVINGSLQSVSGKTKVAVFSTATTRLFLSLFLLITVVPLIIHHQWFTGVIVNAVLILSYQRLGLRCALFLTFVPSVAALTSGLLPFAFIPFIPFIVTGNISLILVFHCLGEINDILKMFLAAIAKFIFLYTSVQLVIPLFLADMQQSIVFTLMGWHQLVTALVGGLIALSICKVLSIHEHGR